ncbi:MAG: hypothetical protein K8T89_01165 [Planctomycetes bacterium]|nr:hypothetical protein [Planctomycetota bacterium]
MRVSASSTNSGGSEMNNECPECGTKYSVTEENIGRRIACKKCFTPLLIEPEGLVKDGPAGSAAPKKEKEEAVERPKAPEIEAMEEVSEEEDRSARRRKREREREPEPEAVAVEEERAPRKARKVPDLSVYFDKLKGVGDVATWLYSIGPPTRWKNGILKSIDAASRIGLMENSRRPMKTKRSKRKKKNGKSAPRRR